MSTSPKLVRELLHEATSGKAPKGRELMERLRDAGVKQEDRHDVARLVTHVTAVARGSNARVARRYADNLADDFDFDPQNVDKVQEQIKVTGGIPSTPHPGTRKGLSSHPARTVLLGVAQGRPLPTVERLTQAGFPTDIAKATHQAAEVVAAATTEGGVSLSSGIARQLALRTAHDNPWPDKADTWDDLADDVADA